jgi:hypothetical protein
MSLRFERNTKNVKAKGKREKEKGITSKEEAINTNEKKMEVSALRAVETFFFCISFTTMTFALSLPFLFYPILLSNLAGILQACTLFSYEFRIFPIPSSDTYSHLT